VAGLGPSFGRGVMTNHWIDYRNADVIMALGSNPVENHPVSTTWIDIAIERGAKFIVVDPRFTRSASKAHLYAPIRPGADIAFLGGLINYTLQNKLYHEEYVLNYTNASFLIKPGYSFKDGIFSGYEAAKRKYDPASWAYQMSPPGPDKKTVPLQDKTLQNSKCVFQITKKHYARYTPEMVSKVCGMPEELFLAIAKTYCATGRPGKAGTILYAMGITQHSNGSQNCRAIALLQLLLGNMGIAGGGVNAQRGWSNVQGSTDMGLLFHLFTGYNPSPETAKHLTLKDYIEKETPKTGFWMNRPKFFISMLKAWWGNNATKENNFCYHYLPKRSANHSWIALFELMYAGKIKGLMCWGQNPSVVGPNANMENKALEKLNWLMVTDLFESETATFWKRPGADPSKIKTEVFLLPGCSFMEKEGSVTNSGRWLQYRWKVIEPLGDSKSDADIVNLLFQRVRALYQKDKEAVSPSPILRLNWDYGKTEVDIEKVVKEINGYTVANGKPVLNFTKLADDGSTACGNWIYSGIYPEEKKNLTKRRIREKEGIGLNSEWGYSWPLNRRIVYNRCSADPTGKPYNKEKWLVKWEGGKWVTRDVPDFGWKDAKTGEMIPPAKSAANPFIMQPEGKGRIFSPVGLADGPLPEHYEPYESPVKNLLSGTQNDPACKIWATPEVDKLAAVGSEEFPIICTTYRVVEHYQGGPTTRNIGWLNELMPELFVEMSVELAQAKRIKNGNKVKIISARGEIIAKACVTPRFKALQLNGKTVEVVGLPWHWGWAGLSTGDVANILTPHIGDANTMIPEYKAFLVNIERAVV